MTKHLPVWRDEVQPSRVMCDEGTQENSSSQLTHADVEDSVTIQSIWAVPFILCTVSKHSDMDHSFTRKLHHACLSFISIHQTEPPLTKVADIRLQLTTHLSTPKRWKAVLAWLVDLWRMVYPHKWSPISYRSRAGQGKFAGQRPTSTAVPRN